MMMSDVLEELPAPPRVAVDENGARPPAVPVTPTTRNVDGERDILDSQLDILDGSLANAGALDGTAVELASLLAAKGDEASALRAHRVLAECGVHLGLWGMSETPRPRAEPAPLGACFVSAADLKTATGGFFDENEKLSLDVRGASTTSLANAPRLA